MLMSLGALVPRYQIPACGVLHLGAHLAEEAATYDRLHMHDVWWIEANPDVIEQIGFNLHRYPAQKIIQALVYSRNNVRLRFNVTNYDGMSSSILQFGTHPEFSPDTVFVKKLTLKTRTVDSLVDEHDIKASFLNMDLQGAELHALKGAKKFLAGVNYIMTEVNCEEVYKGCARVEELDEHLADFERVETYWVPGQGWGDAFYIRKGLNG